MFQFFLLPVALGQPTSYQQITWGGIQRPTKSLMMDYNLGGITYAYPNIPSLTVSYQPIKTIYSNQYQSPQPSRQGYSNPPVLSRSGDIVSQSRQLTEYVKLTLRQFENDPIASPYIDRIIGASSCLSSLEDAIKSIDVSIRLLEDARPQLLRLVDTVKNMQKYTDVETLVRVSGDIVRQIGVLVPKLAPEDAETDVCGDSPSLSFSVIQIVADVIGDIAEDNRIRLSPYGRQQLETSSKVVEGVLKFIKQLGVTFNGFNKEGCVADKETNVKALNSIGTMLDSLAVMFELFGGVSEADDVRERAVYLGKIVAAIQKNELLDIGTLDCDRPGDTSLAASTLDDIADIIAEIGLTELAKQAGVENLI